MNNPTPKVSRTLPLTNGLIAALTDASRLSGVAYALIPLQRCEETRTQIPLSALTAACLASTLASSRPR